MKTLTEKSLTDKNYTHLNRLIDISRLAWEQGLIVKSISSPLGNCYFTSDAIWGKILVKKAKKTKIVLESSI